MRFGSFLIEDKTERALEESDGLRDISYSDGTLSAELLATGEPVARLEITEDKGSLRLKASALGDDNRARVSFACDDGGGFQGFGAHTHDVDHRGQKFPIWVSEQGIGKVDVEEPSPAWFLVGTRHQSYLSVPTMLAPRAGASYGLHATTLYRSIWDLCSEDRLSIEVWEGQVEVLVSPGPTPLDVIRQQTEHTGRISSWPDWTFGVWMEAIGGQGAVEAEAQRLREERIPVSAIWTEDWRGAIEMGSQYILEEDWRADPELYPDLGGMIDRLHAQGMKLMTYFNTFVVEDVDVWPEMLEGGYLVQGRDREPFLTQAPDFEHTGLADLFADGARDFVRGELDTALDLGIDGWMADFAEWYPADPRTVQTSDGSDPEASHHRYPVAWAEVNQEAVQNSGRDDVVIFHRSGYTGAQSKIPVVWAGDQRTSFAADDGLPTIVPILVGLSVAGFPVVTHDIAGYISQTNPPSDKELFFRWTALGALAPVMRTHHGRAAAANWRWSRDRETIDHFRRYAELHTQLFPLFAGLALEASESGAPILRPLSFADPGDTRLHGVKDAYLIGDQLLVAPVLTSSTSTRTVALPSGDWFEWDSGRRHSGGGTIELSLPLSEIGLLARAGAIVPMLEPGVQSLAAATGLTTLADVRQRRVVRVFLGDSGVARDPEGGRYILESGPVSGPIEVEAGAEPDGAPGQYRVRAQEVVFVDGANAKHRLRFEDPVEEIRLRVVW